MISLTLETALVTPNDKQCIKEYGEDGTLAKPGRALVTQLKGFVDAGRGTGGDSSPMQSSLYMRNLAWPASDERARKVPVIRSTSTVGFPRES